MNMKLDEIKISVFLKVLVGYTQAHTFTYCLGELFCWKAGLNSCDRDSMPIPIKPKTFSI